MTIADVATVGVSCLFPFLKSDSVDPLDRSIVRDDRYWYGGMFYHTPDDPDPLVPKRYGLGWTVNFGHPLGKLFLVVCVALMLRPIVLSIFAPGLNASSGCHPSDCHLVP